MSDNSPLAMSDEDFMKLPEPVTVAEAPEATVAHDPALAAEDQAAASPESNQAADAVEADTQVVPDPAAAVVAVVADPVVPGSEVANVDPAAAAVADPAVVAPVAGEAVDAPPTLEALTGFYDKIMAPFKANGKMVELKTPEEAIQLMQMGANYTRKLQELQPHKKLLLMLQNNGLLDEGKLSFLIDVERKNPEAIKKLIKDSGVDPLDIDTNSEPAYVEGSHTVTDAEVLFRTKLDDVSSAPGGTEMLSNIDKTWDKASKEMLWENPEVLSIIQEQRESGVYGRIVAEMDRQITLGQISPSTPFLAAYKSVGDSMVKANAFAGSGDAPVVTEPKVLATRAAGVKSEVSNGDKASAASATRAAPGKADVSVNFLAMSDDQFLKTMAGRV